MTPRQQGTLNEAIDRLTFGGFYETKKLEVEAVEDCKDVFVNVVVGSKGDEGTLAEALCRNNYMFFIGPRGGMYVFGDGLSVRRFKARDIYEASKIY